MGFTVWRLCALQLKTKKSCEISHLQYQITVITNQFKKKKCLTSLKLPLPKPPRRLSPRLLRKLLKRRPRRLFQPTAPRPKMVRLRPKKDVVEAKNGEAEAKKDVAETKEVVEKETEEVVSTNGTEAKEDVVEAKNGEAEAKKDEDKNGHEKNGHENDKEETHKDADMPMPSENGDDKTETTETPTETTEDKETGTKRKASESEVEAVPVSAEKIAKLKENEVDATKKTEEAAPVATEEKA